MVIGAKVILFGATMVFALSAAAMRPAPSTDDPTYTSGGRLRFPAQFRTWVFLSSGMDMSYSRGPAGSMHMFENVFVDPRSYASFQKTGIWPDKTTLVTEFRAAVTDRSINRNGRTQADLMGFDVHVKDASRYAGSWAFFAFDDGDRSAAKIPASASCYRCHSQHAAVDTTFVQFYPTLLPIAMRRHTTSAAYRRDEAAGRP